MQSYKTRLLTMMAVGMSLTGCRMKEQPAEDCRIEGSGTFKNEKGKLVVARRMIDSCNEKIIFYRGKDTLLVQEFGQLNKNQLNEVNAIPHNP